MRETDSQTGGERESEREAETETGRERERGRVRERGREIFSGASRKRIKVVLDEFQR